MLTDVGLTSSEADGAKLARGKEIMEPIQSADNVGAAGWRAERGGFRVYCFACSRSSTSPSPIARGSRCTTCGGTMLSEPETIF
jgi:hypothetical protein